jgi:hypothetical protein
MARDIALERGFNKTRDLANRNRGSPDSTDAVSISLRVWQIEGSEAKPTRSEKVEVGLIFDFQCGEKPDVYPLRYMEDFSTC